MSLIASKLAHWRPSPVALHRFLENALIMSISTMFFMSSQWTSRFIFVAFVLPTAALLVGQRRALPWRNVGLWSLMSFLAVYALATLAGSGAGALLANEIWQSLLLLAFVLVVILVVTENPEVLLLLLFCVALSAAIGAALNICAFYAAIPWAAIPFTRLEGVAHVTMYLNSNSIAGLFAIGASAAMAVIAHPRPGPVIRIVAALAFGLLTLAVLLTQSRGALAGIGIALLSCAIGILSARQWRSLAILFGLTLLGAAAIVLLDPPLITALLGRSSLRPELWSRFFDLATTRLALGYGIGPLPPVTLSDGQVMPHAHNIFLSALVRGGVLALASLLVLLGRAVLGAIAALRSGSGGGLIGLLGTAVMIGAVDYDMLIGNFGWDWVAFWLPVALAFAFKPRFAGRQRDPTAPSEASMPAERSGG